MLAPLEFWSGIGGIGLLLAAAVAFCYDTRRRAAAEVQDVKLHAQKAREALRETLRHEREEAARETREESDRRYVSAERFAKLETDVGWVRAAVERIERAVTHSSER